MIKPFSEYKAALTDAYYLAVELYVDRGFCIKTSPYLSLTDLTERQKRILWKSFINKIDPIEKDYTKDLRKYFRKQEKSVLDNVLSFDDDAGRVVTADYIDAWLVQPQDWNEELTELNTEYNIKAIETGGPSSDEMRKAFDIADAAVNQFIVDKAEVFAFEITNYTNALLKNQFIIGVEAGESALQISKRVQSIFGFNEKFRAARIARTEVAGAANYGSMQSSIQSGVVWGHQWLAAIDDVTRDDHRSLGNDQTKVPIGDNFPMVGIPYPGDPSGAPSQIIQCRCALKPLTRKPIGVE